MAVYRVLGSQLISEVEFLEKGKELVRSVQSAAAGGSVGPTIRLMSGREFAFDVPVRSEGELTPFTPIRFGSPVSIEIRHVYTGRGVGKGDIAVVSGVKTWSAFQASARALNWVAADQEKRANVPMPNALVNGTKIIAYQKAIATRQLTITVELASASHKNGIFGFLSGAFTAAAGIPLFAPYAGVLLAAGQLLPAAGKLLDSITGGHAQWTSDEDLNFGRAGTADADAGFRVIADANADLDGLHFQEGKGLVDAAGRSYAGDSPYVVLAVDGAAQPELEGFTAAVASAELLKRFRLGQTGQNPVVDDLMNLMTIVSDVKYRAEASKLQKKMVNMSGDELDRARESYDALVKNILTDELRP